MTAKTFLVVASLLAIAPISTVSAQDDANDGEKPRPTVRMPDDTRQVVGQAVERPAPAPPPSAAPVQPARPRIESRAASAPAAAAAAADDDQRRRNGARDRGDNPAVGRAVPRSDGRAAPAPAPAQRGRVEGPQNRGGTIRNRGNVYVAPPRYNYYSYPRRYYPVRLWRVRPRLLLLRPCTRGIRRAPIRVTTVAAAIPETTFSTMASCGCRSRRDSRMSTLTATFRSRGRLRRYVPGAEARSRAASHPNRGAGIRTA